MPTTAHLVLVEELERLDELKPEVLGQAAHVVVALYRAGLDYVGIDSALGEEAYALQLPGLLLKHADKLRADYLALLLGVRNARQLVKEAVHGVDIGEVRAQLVAENLYDLLALALTHKPVIDMDALQLLAHGLYKQRGDDGRIHASGEGQQHPAGAYLRAQGVKLCGDESLGELRGGNAFHLGSFVRISHNSLQIGNSIRISITWS